MGPPAGGERSRPRVRSRVPVAWSRPRGSDPTDPSEAGLSLIEVLIAFSILTLAAVAGARLLGASFAVSRATEDQLAAANVATQALETARGAAFTTDAALVTDPAAPEVETVGGVPYTLDLAASWVHPDSTSDACDATSATSSAGYQELLRLTASVSWPGMGVAGPVRQSTTFPPPVGLYSPNDGNLAVEVVGPSGAPVAGVPVTASPTSGATPATIVTSGGGCAFFAYLAPGNYQVTAGGTGEVDPAEVVDPTLEAAVSTGNTASVQVELALGGSLVVSPATSAPLATGLDGSPGVGVTLANPSLMPDPPFDAYEPSGATTIGPLFPFTDGYRLYSGSCPFNDPQGTIDGTAIYSGATSGSPAVRDPVVDLSPGGQATASVPIGEVTIEALTSAGGLVDGASLEATEGDPTSCPTTRLALAPTNSLGLSTTALPYGQWTITVEAPGNSGAASGTVVVWVTPGGDVVEPALVSGSPAPSAPTFSATIPVVVS